MNQTTRTSLFAAALLAAFGAVLAWPRPVGAGEPRAVCLVDVSASVRRTRPDWSAWVGARLESFAERAAAEGARTWVVAVADGVRELVPRGPADALVERLTTGAPLDPVPRSMGAAATDTARALSAVEPWLTGGRGGRVLWLSDGRVGDDPAEAAQVLERLARAGVEVDLVAPPPPSRPDVRVERLEAPRRSESGAPLDVRVELVAEGPARALDALFVAELVDPSDGSVADAVEADVAFEGPGARRLALTLDPPTDGLWFVRGRVLAPGDASAENDRVERSVRSGGTSVGIAIARPRDLAAATAFAARLDAALPGFDWLAAAPGDLTGLADVVDLVVAFEIPPPDLPLDALEPYVHAGGGLLTLGGTSQHVSSGRGRGVDLLPLVCTPPNQDPRDVVLLLDGSGSMQGEPFEAVRSAARDLLRSTPPGDGLSVIVFTEGLHTRDALTVRADESFDERALSRAEARLARLDAPGGETSIVRSLEQWLRQREAEGARSGRGDALRRAVVVLLTDGREDQDTPNVAARVERLRAGLAAANCTLYSVAIGNGVDREFLAALVPSAERRIEPAPSELRRAVADAASSERLLPGPFAVRATPRGLDVGLPAVSAPWERASRAEARAEDVAQVLLADAERRPLAAIWSVGLGRVATFAGSVEWMGDLRERPQRLAGLFRHLARRRADDGARLVRDDRGLVLRLPTPDDATRLEGRLRLEDGSESAVVLESEADGYRVPVQELRSLEVGAQGGWLAVEGQGRWPVPARPPAELRGGGAQLVPPTRSAGGAGAAPHGARAGHPAAPWVLGLAGLVAAGACLPSRRSLPGRGGRRPAVKASGAALR